VHRECPHDQVERLATYPTLITLIRTVASVSLALTGAHQHSLTLLIWALGVFWVGDSADGLLARVTNTETRTGATLDIMSDRLCAAMFYIGFAWYDPSMVVPVGIYLAEYMVIDMFLSLAFLAWPMRSPNYFYLVDRRLWRWNWSHPGKALNSGLFAILMIWTRDPVIASVIAASLLGLKLMSLRWLLQLGLPMPHGCLHTTSSPRSDPGR